jgi:hypothetical protein
LESGAFLISEHEEAMFKMGTFTLVHDSVELDRVEVDVVFLLETVKISVGFRNSKLCATEGTALLKVSEALECERLYLGRHIYDQGGENRHYRSAPEPTRQSPACSLILPVWGKVVEVAPNP